mgnify:CR=1 FL=1
MIYPKNKRYAHKTFESKNFIAYCASFSRNRNGFAHECTLFYNGNNFKGYYVEGLAKWINRTWERFTYESCLLNAIENLPKNLQEIAKNELIESHFKKVEEECNAFLKTFESEYKKLPDSTKETLKNVTLTSEEDAKATLHCMQMINILNDIK